MNQSQSVKIQNQSKREITFVTQLKTALRACYDQAKKANLGMSHCSPKRKEGGGGGGSGADNRLFLEIINQH